MGHYLLQFLQYGVNNLHYIWCKFSIIILNINYAGTAPSNGAIFDVFSDSTKALKNHHILMPCLVLIRCRFNAHFSSEDIAYFINLQSK